MALTKIDDRGLKTPIDLLDNEKIRLGTGNDLELYHNGTHSYLDNSTGYTFFRSNSVSFNGAGGSETMAAFVKDGACELYYDNSKKLETTTDGVQVTGEVVSGTLHCSGKLDMPDSSGATVGRVLLGTSDDLQVFHNGNHNHIDCITAGQNLYIRPSANVYFQDYATDDPLITMVKDGAIELYHNGSKKLDTYASGVTVYNNLAINDNGLLVVGNSGDLQIYHDGSDNFIKNAVAGKHLKMVDADGDMMAVFYQGSSVDLYHNGAKKLETTASGIALAGVENAGAQLKIGANSDLLIEHDGSNTYFGNQTGDLVFQNDANVKITAKAGGTQRFRFDTDGLKFGTDTAAANALDDYEEGTFTPRLGGTNNSGSYYVEGTGSYIKIGRQISVSVRFNNVTLSGSSSGSALISHMPFTAGHSPTNGPSGVADNIQYYKIGIGSADIPNWYLSSGTTIWYGLISRNANTWSDWNIDNFHSSGIYMNFTATYFTA